MHRFTASLALLLALAATSSGLAAQDVEMLGRRYGTPVPEGYRNLRSTDPAAFSFRRAWTGRGGGPAGRFDGAALTTGPQPLGPRNGPVTGTFQVPVLTGLYANSSPVPPFTFDVIASAYFGSGAGTITHYYDEVSGGRVTLRGDVVDWATVPRADTSYTVDQSGLVGGPLGGGGAGNYVWDVLSAVSGIDWGAYDNDGPDGTPNSGDDDGFVDVLAVIHPTRGAECGGFDAPDRMWSHRWSLSAAIDTTFATSTPSANGGVIRVDDYTVQAAVACSGGGLAEIGVFTHELGHAFGLPDLYDTDGSNGTHSGVGTWDLMASGAWGCDNASPETPCHMGAWSKAALGWVDVVTLGPDTDHGTIRVPPVETVGTVYRVNATDGSGEYYLLENRQAIGYDGTVHGEGLLVWQIDEPWFLATSGEGLACPFPLSGANRWSCNRVNAESHMGVRLRQADGLDDLGRGRGRGDGGDPFPGSTGNDAFHGASVPSPQSWQGGFAGLTVFAVTPVGDDIDLRLTTRQTTLTVQATGTATQSGLFLVDGQATDPPATAFLSPPFVPRLIEAAAGETLAPGARRPFLQWQDDPGAPRQRTLVTPLADTGFVAEYGGTEYQVAVALSGGQNGVLPGAVAFTPDDGDGWVAPGTALTLTATAATGFAFSAWSGDLAGFPNPASVSVDAPLDAGADFDLIYAIAAPTVDVPAATPLDVQLMAANGTGPIQWTLWGGVLPEGLVLGSDGRITGASLEDGSFPVTVLAVDGVGLSVTADLTLEISRPSLSIEELTSQFLLVGPRLTDTQRSYLNREGNNLGPYDLGDFRAWALSDPALPLSRSVATAGEVYFATVTLSPRATGDGGHR